jgi:hypothetical protein
MASALEREATTRRWRRVEYERLVDLGVFVVDVLRPPASVTPLAAPATRIAVADLLP